MLSGTVIRLAQPGDAAAIAEMSRNYIEEGLGWSWQAPRVLRAIRDRSTNVAVMTESDPALVVGFGIMLYRDETAHLTLLALRPEHRNRGLGSVLVNWLEKPARIAGAERIRVEARADNPRAIRFYERLGFRRMHIVPGYYSGLADAVQLEKRLGPEA
jgi:ribosomal protein S18 acetylase RimI-like enzyme